MTHLLRAKRRAFHTLISGVAVAALALGLGACSSSTQGDKAASSSKNEKTPSTVTLVTHNNFKVPDDLKAKFEKDSGMKLNLVTANSGPELVNKLKLTKDKPIGDAVYGLATNDMGMVAKEKLLAPAKISLPQGADKSKSPDAANAVPIDRGDICVNIDKTYFEKKKLAEPQTLDDLVKPEYKGLFVTINPSDVTGFGFFTAVVAKYGDKGWQDYWKKLKANDVKVTPGWTEAYENNFSAGGKGKYPIVLSYEGSPAYTVNDAKTETTTKSLPKTCYTNVEYAGVLAGAKNPKGAQKVIKWLLSDEVQASIPDNMYMYPVASGVKLPDAYKFAPQSGKALIVPGADIVKNQETWIKSWTDLMK